MKVERKTNTPIILGPELITEGKEPMIPLIMIGKSMTKDITIKKVIVELLQSIIVQSIKENIMIGNDQGQDLTALKGLFKNNPLK